MEIVTPEAMKSAKFATEHLGHCEHPKCKFCSNSICCFGMRDIGCVILDPDLLWRTDKISLFLKSANEALYGGAILDSTIPRSLKEIERSIIDMIKYPAF